MSKIIINNKYEVPGEITVTRTLDTTKNPNKLIIEGICSTHFYFEEIISIETDRYMIDGITVVQEGFGSNDININYSFIAGNITIKGGTTIYTEKEIEKLLNKEKEDKEVEELWQKIIKKIKSFVTSK